MPHQFQSGQLVRICRSIRYAAPKGDCEIVRPLPDEGGELRYRAKSATHERVVKEIDLELHNAIR